MENDSQNQFQIQRENLQEVNKGAFDSGIMALRIIIFMNGAAALALFAFISRHWSVDSGMPSALGPAVHALIFFVVGVFVAALAIGCGYMRFFFEGRSISAALEYDKPATLRDYYIALILVYATIFLGLLPYVLFAAGAWSMYNVLG